MALGLEILLFFVIGIIVLIFIGLFVIIYNSLIRLRKDIDRALANIDVLLKQRGDELTKLVDTVKGYMKFEKKVLTEVTAARTSYNNASTIQGKAKADSMISQAFKTLFAVAENYPQLQSQKSFQQLQERISGLENEIADRREFYNASVTNFNTKIHTIPDTFFARMLGYTDMELFKATEAEKKDVKIDL